MPRKSIRRSMKRKSIRRNSMYRKSNRMKRKSVRRLNKRRTMHKSMRRIKRKSVRRLNKRRSNRSSNRKYLGGMEGGAPPALHSQPSTVYSSPSATEAVEKTGGSSGVTSGEPSWRDDISPLPQAKFGEKAEPNEQFGSGGTQYNNLNYQDLAGIPFYGIRAEIKFRLSKAEERFCLLSTKGFFVMKNKVSVPSNEDITQFANVHNKMTHLQAKKTNFERDHCIRNPDWSKIVREQNKEYVSWKIEGERSKTTGVDKITIRLRDENKIKTFDAMINKIKTDDTKYMLQVERRYADAAAKSAEATAAAAAEDNNEVDPALMGYTGGASNYRSLK